MSAIASAKKEDATYDKWQAREDLQTITRAREIEKDPKRMAHVRRAAKEKLAEMKHVEALAAGKKA
jgi:hypothetical protein